MQQAAAASARAPAALGWRRCGEGKSEETSLLRIRTCPWCAKLAQAGTACRAGRLAVWKSPRAGRTGTACAHLSFQVPSTLASPHSSGQHLRRGRECRRAVVNIARTRQSRRAAAANLCRGEREAPQPGDPHSQTSSGAGGWHVLARGKDFSSLSTFERRRSTSECLCAQCTPTLRTSCAVWHPGLTPGSAAA